MVLAEVVVVVLAGVAAAVVVLVRRRSAAPDPIAGAAADAERIREAVDFVTAWELERPPLYAEAAERLRAAAPPTADLLPLAQGPDEVLAGLALRCLGDGAGGTTIVRRYRDGSAPLVRDSVRGYRTGRLDQVLAGDFDLF